MSRFTDAELAQMDEASMRRVRDEEFRNEPIKRAAIDTSGLHPTFAAIFNEFLDAQRVVRGAADQEEA